MNHEHFIDKEKAVQAVKNGDWSPRFFLQKWVFLLKKTGYTLSVIGKLLGIKKQAVCQWEKTIKSPCWHVEQRALDRLVGVAEINMNRVVPYLRPWVGVIRKTLAGNFVKSDILQSLKEVADSSERSSSKKHYVQVWVPSFISESILNLSNNWIGSIRGFSNWIVKSFLNEKPYKNCDYLWGFDKTNPMNEKLKPMSLRLDHKVYTQFRSECKNRGVAFSVFLTEALLWASGNNDAWTTEV